MKKTIKGFLLGVIITTLLLNITFGAQIKKLTEKVLNKKSLKLLLIYNSRHILMTPHKIPHKISPMTPHKISKLIPLLIGSPIKWYFDI